jgi:hypothetical protein
MKSKYVLFSFCLVVILFSLVPALTASETAGTAKGRTTAGINLRAAPGLSGKIITGLDAGTIVAITGEQAGWYQIAYEDETYGYRGWVYGKYVETLAAPATAPPADTTMLAAPRPAPSPLPPEPAGVAKSDPAGDPATVATQMPTNTIELIQAAKPQAAAQDQTIAQPAAENAAVLRPDSGKTAARQSARKDLKSEPVTNSPAAAGTGPGFFLSIVLKISSVFLSCLALLISYRTFQLVSATGRAT